MEHFIEKYYGMCYDKDKKINIKKESYRNVAQEFLKDSLIFK